MELYQNCILEGFSKVLPNSHFRNGRIKRNWSNIFIIFLLIVWNINSLNQWINYFKNNLNNLSIISSFLKQEFWSFWEFHQINLSRIPLWFQWAIVMEGLMVKNPTTATFTVTNTASTTTKRQGVKTAE